jgi:DNA-binding response OmpR family regulator
MDVGILWRIPAPPQGLNVMLHGVNVTPAAALSDVECRGARILIVDDEPVGRAFLADNLTADGFQVLEAGSVAAAKRLIATRVVNLAIIDIGLPDGDGLELVRFVRGADRAVGRANPDLPLIVLSGRGTEIDRVRGFDRGADDYVSKPYSYPELVRRISVALKRARHAAAGARMEIGPLEIDALARQAWVEGEPVKLSSKEFSLLRTLASEPSRVFTREELMRIVWGWAEPVLGSSRTLDGHASRLRRKICRGETKLVINVWGVGYRLIDGTKQ